MDYEKLGVVALLGAGLASVVKVFFSGSVMLTKDHIAQMQQLRSDCEGKIKLYERLLEEEQERSRKYMDFAELAGKGAVELTELAKGRKRLDP